MLQHHTISNDHLNEACGCSCTDSVHLFAFSPIDLFFSRVLDVLIWFILEVRSLFKFIQIDFSQEHLWFSKLVHCTSFLLISLHAHLLFVIYFEHMDWPIFFFLIFASWSQEIDETQKKTLKNIEYKKYEKSMKQRQIFTFLGLVVFKNHYVQCIFDVVVHSFEFFWLLMHGLG